MEEIQEYFLKQHEDVSNNLKRLSQRFDERGIDILNFQKNFFIQLLLISVAFIASPKIFDLEILNNNLFNIGVILMIVNCILIVLILRESTDADLIAHLGTIKYLEILKARQGKIQDIFNKNDFNQDVKEEYGNFLSQQIVESKKGEDKEKEMLNYLISGKDKTNSIVVFLFLLSIVFITLSFFVAQISLYYIALITIILLVLSVKNSAHFLLSKISFLLKE